jgi:uncharacterized protein YbjT (DUF2867 family)
MTELVSPPDESETLAEQSSAAFVRLTERLIRARVLQDGKLWREALDETAEHFRDVMALADVLGRRRIQMLAERAERRDRAELAAWNIPASALIFAEAVAHILFRRPGLAKSAKEMSVPSRCRGCQAPPVLPRDDGGGSDALSA